jgi:hypothetical protein
MSAPDRRELVERDTYSCRSGGNAHCSALRDQASTGRRAPPTTTILS